MKKLIAKSLKQITSGTFNSAGTIVFAVIMMAFVIAAILASPILLIWGLQLLGLPVELTWKSWFGALLIVTILRGKFSSSTKEK